MIGWEDVYKVVVAMVPLYVPLVLGYGSVKWWHMFTPEQCDAINLFASYFIIPLFNFEFTSHVNPLQMNYLFIAADVISKSLVLLVLTLWANCSGHGTYSWSITSFSLSALNNSLVVGVPLMKAMYGQMGMDLVIQSSVVQSILWLMVLLFMLELRRTRTDFSTNTITRDSGVVHGELAGKDLEGSTNFVVRENPSFRLMMKMVWLKLAKNPNSYSCILGLAWAFVSNRWHLKMPSIVEGSILIMSRAGAGASMFSMGLFMALQEKIIACGASLTMFGMILRFVGGPGTMAIGSFAVGLRGEVLHVSIIQAALPQAIASFVFAKEYGLHANVLSTAVIFGTIVSLPVLIAYYVGLELLH
ncbi:unnamed protein product [Ilex paraguariensis]|uniref:Auxin efflux carrier component n=1 Tax=Ilex paraguariensis TaxID=185542 RepID=A0ABC8UUY1_9AQUA